MTGGGILVERLENIRKAGLDAVLCFISVDCEVSEEHSMPFSEFVFELSWFLHARRMLSVAPSRVRVSRILREEGFPRVLGDYGRSFVGGIRKRWRKW